MTKTEAAQILARSANRAGITRSSHLIEPATRTRMMRDLSAHLSEVAYTAQPGGPVAQALAIEPAVATIFKNL